MKKIIKYSKKNDDLVRIKESLMFENKINLKNTPSQNMGVFSEYVRK